MTKGLTVRSIQSRAHNALRLEHSLTYQCTVLNPLTERARFLFFLCFGQLVNIIHV